MAKTNFMKAEEALSEALQKMVRMELLERADRAQGQGTAITEEEKNERGMTVQFLKREIKRLHQNDKEIYKKLGVTKAEFDELLKHVGEGSKEVWEKVIAVKEQVIALVKLLPKLSDEELVLQQRKRHKTKRFNVNEKWLPLK